MTGGENNQTTKPLVQSVSRRLFFKWWVRDPSSVSQLITILVMSSQMGNKQRGLSDILSLFKWSWPECGINHLHSFSIGHILFSGAWLAPAAAEPRKQSCPGRDRGSAHQPAGSVTVSFCVPFSQRDGGGTSNLRFLFNSPLPADSSLKMDSPWKTPLGTWHYPVEQARLPELEGSHYLSLMCRQQKFPMNFYLFVDLLNIKHSFSIYSMRARCWLDRRDKQHSSREKRGCSKWRGFTQDLEPTPQPGQARC